jgi:hypothetical protein
VSLITKYVMIVLFIEILHYYIKRSETVNMPLRWASNDEATRLRLEILFTIGNSRTSLICQQLTQLCPFSLINQPTNCVVCKMAPDIAVFLRCNQVSSEI